MANPYNVAPQLDDINMPIALSDSELDIVFAAARPLAVQDRDPKVCPSCKSPYWDRPRRSEAKSTKRRSGK
jgi:hypothetical protein